MVYVVGLVWFMWYSTVYVVDILQESCIVLEAQCLVGKAKHRNHRSIFLYMYLHNMR